MSELSSVTNIDTPHFTADCLFGSKLEPGAFRSIKRSNTVRPNRDTAPLPSRHPPGVLGRPCGVEVKRYRQIALIIAGKWLELAATNKHSLSMRSRVRGGSSAVACPRLHGHSTVSAEEGGAIACIAQARSVDASTALGLRRDYLELIFPYLDVRRPRLASDHDAVNLRTVRTERAA